MRRNAGDVFVNFSTLAAGHCDQQIECRGAEMVLLAHRESF
jgi:hypothetical protein